MNPHCEPGRPPIRHSDRLLRIKRGNLPTFGKPSSQRQAEEVLLPEDVRKQRQEDIFAEERKAKDYKQSKFGFDGELYKVQDDKVKPIQDKVYTAIEEVAKERRLDFMWDKSAKGGLLYTNAAFDRTDDVMVKLGLKR